MTWVAGAPVIEEAVAEAAADAAPLVVPWAQALELLHVHSLEETLDALQLQKEDTNHITDKNSLDVLGRLDWSWGTTISATCRGCGHARCKLLITVRPGAGFSEWVQSDLVKWLAAGRGLTVAEHRARGLELKVLHGMRPRIPAA